VTGYTTVVRPAEILRARTAAVGAVIGGLLVLSCGVAEIAFYFYQHLTGWLFGAMPGVISAFVYGVGPDNIFKISACAVGIIWVILGIVIMATAQSNLHGVAVFGLVATVLLLVVPACEAFVLLQKEDDYTWQVWAVLWVVVLPLLLVIAMCLLVALSASPRPNLGLKVATVVFLVGVVVICVGYSIWNFPVSGGGSFFSGPRLRIVVPGSIFALGWLVLALTVSSRPVTNQTLWPT